MRFCCADDGLADDTVFLSEFKSFLSCAFSISNSWSCKQSIPMIIAISDNSDKTMERNKVDLFYHDNLLISIKRRQARVRRGLIDIGIGYKKNSSK